MTSIGLLMTETMPLSMQFYTAESDSKEVTPIMLRALPALAARIYSVACSPSTPGILTSMKMSLMKLEQQLLEWSAFNLSIAS